MKKLNFSLAVLACISLSCTTLFSQDIPQKGPIPFDTYDVNKDGFISESEFYDARAARMTQKAEQGMPMKNAGNAPEFSTFDTDKDGKLTKIELLEGQMKQMQNKKANKPNGQTMKGMGKNMPAFEEIDSNNDGYLSETEMREFRKKRMQAKASQGKMMKNNSKQCIFSEIDTNKDGKVDKQEFSASHKKRLSMQ